MATSKNWQSLPHRRRLQLLAGKTDDQITKEFLPAGKSVDEFKQILSQERALWLPGQVSDWKPAGKPPTKHSLLGSYRDLERSEALLELIDNSIDVWRARRRAHPKFTDTELNIFITIDDKLGLLRYEDNAGGVPEDKLDQLVVPGYSDTTDLSATIGSYKTGGKKAMFRLATAAQILTRYWDPTGRVDRVLSVQLDENWLNDPELYQFEYGVLADRSALEKGHTEYVLRLHEEPEGGTQWYDQLNLNDAVKTEIEKTYCLLLVRNPQIHIFYRDRSRAIVPNPEELYEFSGAKDTDIDITPQQVIFETTLPFQGVEHAVSIEVIIGSRKGVGAGEYGLDLYGNDRLFVACDRDLFQSALPRSNAVRLFRGLINIRGPNIFVPWDTHKRHLNVDREMTRLISTHPLITKVFENWFTTYTRIGGGSDTKARINIPLKTRGRKTNDLPIPNRSVLKIDRNQKRGKLPDTVFAPRAVVSKKISKFIDIKLRFSRDEAETVKSWYVISGDVTSSGVKSEIAANIHDDVLKRARRAKSK